MRFAIEGLPPRMREQAEAKLREGAKVRGIYAGVVEEKIPSKPAHSPISKYRNKRVEYDGRKFDSVKECDRYRVLRALQDAGDIADLECQKRYRIELNGIRLCTYVADFVYRRKRGGKPGKVVEDVKGWKNGSAYRMFKVKAALMRAVLGIEVEEI